jgi:aminoglycoside phosphotransferase (APT) family kinase protein
MESYNVAKPMEQLEPSLAEIIHHVAGPAAEIEQVENWGIGALNRCLKITTRHPAERFFLKIENDEILPVSRRGQIAREVAGNRLMNEVGVRCPEVLAYDCEGGALGIRYLVEEFIDARLLWELRDELTEADWDQLRIDIQDVLAKMQAAASPLFGDLYPGGWIGQFETYNAYYRRVGTMDLADCQRMDLLDEAAADLVRAALERAAEAVVYRGPAGFFHGDLGIHNLLAEQAQNGPRLGWVIDFGNALFLPAYMNEDGVRRHGGFGLPARDCTSYGVSPEAYTANDLLDTLNWTAFAGMLCRTGRWKKDPREFVERLVLKMNDNWQL